MVSLLDPKSEEEEELDEPDEKWYAVIIYDDASGIWHISDHQSEEEAMGVLREQVFDSIGGNDEGEDEELVLSDDYRQTLAANYKRWTLEDMNEHLEGENGNNTVFCKKGGGE